MTRFWHGGAPGLRPGELLLPQPGRKLHDGCAFCEARSKGLTIGGIDPPSAKVAVYVTQNRSYARFYASLYGRGDLYLVEPIGPVEKTQEDHIASWTCEGARVKAVYERGVLLTPGQRRRLFTEWGLADERVARERLAG